jgi:hypothetical protein
VFVDYREKQNRENPRVFIPCTWQTKNSLFFNHGRNISKSTVPFMLLACLSFDSILRMLLKASGNPPPGKLNFHLDEFYIKFIYIEAS